MNEYSPGMFYTILGHIIRVVVQTTRQFKQKYSAKNDITFTSSSY